ncbi:MAG TPA: NUDIX domain-containing protein [Dehalococcoidia bacterium]|nr:NUDIX domain-containing protein [Dehalococcoidia bacterium]
MGLDPFDGGGAPTPTTYWRPRESERGAYTEKKLGDELLAIWEHRDLPADAVVTHVTLIPYRGEKPVVAWRQGKMLLPEGNVREGESVDAAIKRIAEEQAGILDPTFVHLGHFRSRATSLSKTHAPDTITYQALYGVEVGSLADFPSDTNFERRIILQRDLNTLIRSSYVEVRREYTDSLDPWLLERLKANLRG